MCKPPHILSYCAHTVKIISSLSHLREQLSFLQNQRTADGTFLPVGGRIYDIAVRIERGRSAAVEVDGVLHAEFYEQGGKLGQRQPVAVLLPPVDDGKDNPAFLCHADGTARRTPIADVVDLRRQSAPPYPTYRLYTP